MNTTATLTQLQELKLNGMLASYRSQLDLPVNEQLQGHELLATWPRQKSCTGAMNEWKHY